jgi:hypothetical protein
LNAGGRPAYNARYSNQGEFTGKYIANCNGKVGFAESNGRLAADPWNEWPYATAKLVLFRVLIQNPALKFSPEIDRLRSEILEHRCSLTGDIYVGESLATNAAHK